ncbi:MAG: hypothetical protein VX850_00595 [Gemmatimonadota bacterium]|nr:hypothetical protein [Gemmatimonadota bacterium]
MPTDQESLVLNNGPNYLSYATDFSEQERSGQIVTAYYQHSGMAWWRE